MAGPAREAAMRKDIGEWARRFELHVDAVRALSELPAQQALWVCRSIGEDLCFFEL